MNFYDSAVRWCVPVFIMLSGIFFLDEKKNISLSDIYKKYILRIFTALIFWGLLYGFLRLVVKYFILHQEIVCVDIIKVFLKLIFGPPWYHLWFLYLIIGIYILIPLLRVFIFNSTKKDMEYFLVIFFIFGLTIPTLGKILIIIDPRLIINFSILELTGYVGYFFAGHYFSKYQISRKIINILYALGLISVLITILLTSMYSKISGNPQILFYGYLLPTTMVSSYAIFLFFKENFQNTYLSDKLIKILMYISSCTFGIYLVHDFVNIAFLIVGITANSFNPIFSIPLMSISNFIISLMLVSAIKKIPLLNKYII